MHEQIAVLYQAFHKFSAAKFDNRLPTPTITIQTKGNKSAIGWCSSAPRWQGPKEATYEINLCAEYAAIPFLDVMEVLLHEMVHLSKRGDDKKGTRQREGAPGAAGRAGGTWQELATPAGFGSDIFAKAGDTAPHGSVSAADAVPRGQWPDHAAPSAPLSGPGYLVTIYNPHICPCW